MKKEAEASFAKMIEKIKNSTKRNEEILQIKTDIIASVRIAQKAKIRKSVYKW
jgi:hypothetical protein